MVRGWEEMRVDRCEEEVSSVGEDIAQHGGFKCTGRLGR